MTANNHANPLPRFTADAEILSSNGSRALCNLMDGMHALHVLLDGTGNDVSSLDPSARQGVGHLIALILKEVSKNVYGELIPLNSSNVQSLLDAAREASHGE